MNSYYKPGDWNVRCDLCKRKRKASECRLNWKNLFVCKDTCYDPRHPQDYVKGIPDNQTVAFSRPAVAASVGETTLRIEANKDDTRVYLNSIAGLADKDSVGITLDNGTIHWTYINGDPLLSGGALLTKDGDVIYAKDGTPILIKGGMEGSIILGSYLPENAGMGNTVYLPSINHYTFVTALIVTPTEL